MTTAPLPPAQAAALAGLFMQLAHNKDTRASIAKAVKKAAPDSPHAAAFMDIDIEERFQQEKDEREAARIKDEGERRVAKMESDRAALLAGDLPGVAKYDEKQVAEIEKIMQANGTTDYKVGAILYAHENPTPSSDPKYTPTKHGATWEFPTLGNMAFSEFAKDPTKAARDGAYADIESFNRKRR